MSASISIVFPTTFLTDSYMQGYNGTIFAYGQILYKKLCLERP